MIILPRTRQTRLLNVFPALSRVTKQPAIISVLDISREDQLADEAVNEMRRWDRYAKSQNIQLDYGPEKFREELLFTQARPAQSVWALLKPLKNGTDYNLVGITSIDRDAAEPEYIQIHPACMATNPRRTLCGLGLGLIHTFTKHFQDGFQIHSTYKAKPFYERVFSLLGPNAPTFVPTPIYDNKPRANAKQTAYKKGLGSFKMTRENTAQLSKLIQNRSEYQSLSNKTT